MQKNTIKLMCYVFIKKIIINFNHYKLGASLNHIDKKLSISEKRIMNRFTVVRTYSGALAGIHVLLILDF